CVHFLTGPGEDLPAVLEGLRRVGQAGREAGVRVALEPVQREFAHLWSVVSDLDAAAALVEEAGADVDLMFDTWHLWNSPTLLDDVARLVDRVAGVHVADWRDPTRNTNDRAFPGDGVADLPAILRALDDAGYAGWYDVEIFSDNDLDGSLWALTPNEAARRAKAGFDRVWAAAERR
ncbi:MAG TPA: sugar phosphate isomerase/epimerase family protein, partial [Gaiellaceae bacterium]|nr:sugar phosphate isomerase/epimerase family protein [Gaiellaceae bacterium]